MASDRLGGILDMDELRRFADRHGLPESTFAELLTVVAEVHPTVFDPEDSVLAIEEDRSGAEPSRGDADHLTLERCLGRGAMGEVWLAQDSRLSRPVAVKLLGHALLHDEGAVARFLDEARATAQLVHPGIVPVHDVGWWSDGRPFYTMDVIRGETLTAQIEALHADFSPDGLHRLVARFRRVCDAVGYAHSRGVVHRDLKPDNVMVGAFGQVLVADWGLVRADQAAAEPVHTERPVDQTAGLAGTPRFMSPEQVNGGPIGTASDVYSLGSILVNIVTGCHAFPQPHLHGVLLSVARGRPTIPEVGPEALRRIASQALQVEPEDRYPTAAELGDAVEEWLDGAAKRARALEDVSAGQRLLPRIAALEARADALRRQATASGAALRSWMPVEDKVATWRVEDEAFDIDRQVATLKADRLALFESALSHDPDLPEALEHLARHHRDLVVRAESVADDEAAGHHLRQLRRYDRGEHDDFLAGEARLSVQTDPPGAIVTCRPYVDRDRRRVPGEPTVLGRSPLIGVPLPMGEYELTLEAPGRLAVTYPVCLGRQEHWDGSGPGHAAVAVHLPRADALGPDECYVPAGPHWLGTHDTSFASLDRQRGWCDGLVMATHPVTNADYLVFLNDLRDRRGLEVAMAHVPRERSSNPQEPGPPCYGFTETSGFFLKVDGDGDSWHPRYPVLLVDWGSAVAYAAWRSERTGHRWRLPSEREWEKAMRGPAGRNYPWGSHPDPAFMNIRGSFQHRPLPAVVDAFPEDCSVYGVRGMAGNQLEWCSDEDGEQGERRVLRGGCWFFTARNAHGAARYFLEPHRRGDTVGFRLCRDLTPGRH